MPALSLHDDLPLSSPLHDDEEDSIDTLTRPFLTPPQRSPPPLSSIAAAAASNTTAGNNNSSSSSSMLLMSNISGSSHHHQEPSVVEPVIRARRRSRSRDDEDDHHIHHHEMSMSVAASMAAASASSSPYHDDLPLSATHQSPSQTNVSSTQQQQQQQQQQQPGRKSRRKRRTNGNRSHHQMMMNHSDDGSVSSSSCFNSNHHPSSSSASSTHFYKSSLFLLPPGKEETPRFLQYCCSDKTVVRSTLSVMNMLAKLVIWTSVVLLAAAVIWYSYELKNNGTDPHLIAWFSAGAFVLLGFPISMYGIVGHLANYNQPHVQCYVVRILWMVPIYSMESWLCLRFHRYAIYIETLRDCYESYVLYSFLQFLIQTLGGEEALILMLKDKSPTRGVHMWGLQYCVKPWLMGQPVSKSIVPYHPHTSSHHHKKYSSNSGSNSNLATTTSAIATTTTTLSSTATATTTTTTSGSSPKLDNSTTSSSSAPVVIKRVQWTSPFFVKCKFGVLQYVLLKFVSSVFVMILELKGWYKEGDFTYRGGYLYICFVTNASQCWALYCLIFFYYATHNELSPIRPVGKFLSVKALVFFTWWQSVFISILYQMDFIHHYRASGGSPSSTTSTTAHMEWTSEDVAKGLQDYLICIEMFLAAIVHTFCFPHSEYSIPAVEARARALQQQQQQYHHPQHVGKASGGGSSYYDNHYYRNGNNNNNNNNSNNSHYHMASNSNSSVSGSYHKRLGRKQYLYPTTAATTYSPPRSYYARNRRTDRLRMVTSSSAASQNNYSWSDDPNDDNDTLAVSSKTSDQYHPDDDVEMASRAVTMTTPTPSLEDDEFDTADQHHHHRIASSPPSLPSLMSVPTGAAASAVATTGDGHRRQPSGVGTDLTVLAKDDDEGVDPSFVNVSLDDKGGDNEDGDDEEEDSDEDDIDADYNDEDDDDDEDDYEARLSNASYPQHRPPPPQQQRPNFVRALWDSAIPRDLGENTVGIVKGDYVVEKKTLLHHAATSDNYDLFSHTRVLRVHPKTSTRGRRMLRNRGDLTTVSNSSQTLSPDQMSTSPNGANN